MDSIFIFKKFARAFKICPITACIGYDIRFRLEAIESWIQAKEKKNGRKGKKWS